MAMLTLTLAGSNQRKDSGETSDPAKEEKKQRLLRHAVPGGRRVRQLPENFQPTQCPGCPGEFSLKHMHNLQTGKGNQTPGTGSGL